MPQSVSFLTQQELMDMGFKSVGKGCQISRFARFYGISHISLGDYVRIDDFCVLSGNITLSDYIHIAPFCGLYASHGGASISIQSYSTLSSKVAVYAQSDDYTGMYMTNPMVPQEYTHVIASNIVLGKHVIIGSGCTILPHVTIGDVVAIGANSLVLKDVPPFTVYAGSPAKYIKPRDKKLLDLEREFLIQSKE